MTPKLDTTLERDAVHGLYEVRGLLGQGGMGTVHLVRHRSWQLDLAMKTPRKELMARPEARDDFVREAETWIGLGLHPNLVACFYVRTIEGVPRVFAEYVPGGSLADAIATRSLYGGGPQDAFARVLDIALDSAFGLAHAHENGVIHQDMKPANTLLTKNGAKVTDFGLARALGRVGESVATAGMTPAYASPEQLQQRPLGRQTDVWSWAATVIEMLTGEATWMSSLALPIVLQELAANDPASESAVAKGLLPPLPASLVSLLDECLEIEAEKRLGAFDEIASRLGRIAAAATGRSERLPPKAVGTVADTLNNTGASLFEIGQVTSAGEAFARALRLDPAHERASFNLSLLRWRGAETSDEAVTRVLRERTENNARSETARGLEASVALERGDVSRFDELAGRGSLGIPAEDNALRDARRSLGEGNALVHTWPVPAERYGAVAVSPTGEQAFLAGKDVVDVFDLEAGDVVATLAGRRAGIDPNDGYAQYTHVLMAAHGALLCAVRADVRLSREGNSTRSRTEQTTLEVYDVRLRKRVWELPLGLGTAQGICLVDRTEARVAVALRDFSREKYAELTVIDLNARTARVVDVLAWPEVMSAFGAGIDAVAGMHDANAPLILVSYSIYFGILDVDRNEMIAHWRVDASLSDLQVSRDGRRAIGGGHCATEWDISSQVQRPLSGVQRYVNNHGVQAVRFFANEKRLIASDFADVVRIWDLERGRCLCTLATGAGGSVALDTFARGTRAVVVCEGARRTTSGRGDGAVQVYSLAPEEPSLLAASTIARPLEIDAVTSRVDRTDHLSGELDAAMNNGDLSKALRLLDLARRDEDLARSPKIQSIAVSLARLPSVRRGRFLEAWPVDTIHHELGHINVVAMSADGDTTAVGAMDDGRCAVFSDREGGKRLELSIGDGEVYGLALSADGAVLGGVTASGSVSCFELRARRRLFQFGYRDEVFSTAAIDSAGTIMIASDYSGGARVFDVRAGRERGALRGHERVVNAATVSQNGHIAGTVGQDKRLCIWRIDDLALIRVIELPEPSSSIAISDDATFVCCCDSAGTVRAFSIESGDLIGSFSDGDSSGLGLWLSPDSRLAITAAKGGMFCLWDVAERTLMKKLQTADRFVYEIIGSTDVHKIVLRGSAARVWSLAWELHEG